MSDLPGVATVSEPVPETLVADYYDTDDLRLLLAGVKLRRRRGGPGEGWHLKLPAHAAEIWGAAADVTAAGATEATGELWLSPGRGRLDLSAAGVTEHVPVELERLVRVHTRGGALRPVARIETRRYRTTLRDAAGTALVEILSDDVAAQTVGAATSQSRWNEVEVEPAEGSHRLLRAVTERLRAAGLSPAARSAKLARALSVDPGATTGSPPAQRLSARSPAGDVILAYLRAQVARIKDLDPAVRRDETDAVHQMRVTTRRLRAALQAFPMVLPGPATARLNEELRWLGRVLGTARDIEVLSEHFAAELDATPDEMVVGPVRARVSAHFARREAAARAAMADALDSARYFALLDELDGLLADPPLATTAAAPAAELLPRAIGKAYRRARRRMRRARRMRQGPARDTMLHSARKAVKRARYAAEAARPAVGGRARRLATGLKAVQSALGDLQDAVTARAAAREIGIAAHLAGENAFTFGLLTERSSGRARDAQRAGIKAWKQASRPKLRRWVR
jgi:CHAD domain-containing protein